MLPDRVSNPGPLTYESGALPIALRGPALVGKKATIWNSNALTKISCDVLSQNRRHCETSLLIGRRLDKTMLCAKKFTLRGKNVKSAWESG